VLLRDDVLSKGQHDVVIVAIAAGLHDDVAQALEEIETLRGLDPERSSHPRRPDVLSSIRKELLARSLLPVPLRRGRGRPRSDGATAESVRRRDRRERQRAIVAGRR